MLYIQKNIQFLELEQELPDSYLVGDNIENYEDGAYLLLSEEQEQYHNDYPEASRARQSSSSGVGCGSGVSAIYQHSSGDASG